MTDARFNGGRSGLSVSTSAVDLINTSTSGLTIAGCERWVFNVSVSGADITLQVYLAAGDNCGLIEFTSLGGTVATGATHSVECESNASTKIRVTAKTASGTATVNSDFRGY